VNLIVPQTGNSESATVYVSTTGCGTTDGCFSTVVPVTAPTNTPGNFITLPVTPNSLVFNGQGTSAYLGTDSGRLGSVGLAVLNASSNSVTQFAGLPGKVLAVSPDGSKVIISDTSPADGPNRVFVFDTATNTSPTFLIIGATAAAFSPDSLKAYIVAGSTLYVYSKLDGLRTIALAAPANGVSFLSEGAFAYVAGGASSALSVWRTCDNGRADTVSVPAVPTFIQTLPGAAQLLPGDTPNTFHLFAVAPPNVDVISVNTTPSGCTPAVVDGPVSSFNLGQPNFVAKQLIVSQDGATAYVVASNLSSILVFNIPGQTSSAIWLVGNPLPLGASLTPDGNLLYVGASDGSVHVVNTVAGGDVQQISFPQGLCQNSAGQRYSTTCNPDLVAVQP
jgi:WD40 repeat protein